MGALEDLAAKLNMDPVDLLLKNIKMAAPENDTFHRADTYRDELMIASDLIGWKKNWHPRGHGASGPVKRGLGVAIHTWGGRGHQSVAHPRLLVRELARPRLLYQGQGLASREDTPGDDAQDHGGEQIPERRYGLTWALHVSKEAPVLHASVFHHVAQGGERLRAQAPFRQRQREQPLRFRAAGLRKSGSRVERGEIFGGEIYNFIGKPAEFAVRKFKRSHGRGNLNTIPRYGVSQPYLLPPVDNSVFLSVLRG